MRRSFPVIGCLLLIAQAATSATGCARAVFVEPDASAGGATDAPAPPAADASVPPVFDASVPLGADAAVPPAADAVVPPVADANPPRPDANPPRPDAGPPRPDAQPPVVCETPSTPADRVSLARDLEGSYQVFDLGSIPGMSGQYGGAAVPRDDPNTLFVVGKSDSPDAEIHTVELERGPCGHIVEFVGRATRVADTPHAAANLAFADDNLLFYGERWPGAISQLRRGASSPARTCNLRDLGLAVDEGEGPSGLGFVPSWLAAAGELRAVTWPNGRWLHLDLKRDGALYDLTAVDERAIADEPGGFAYVPPGSPGFDRPSILMVEWLTEQVAAYEVSSAGDPIARKRTDFITKLGGAWAIYLDQVSGDLLLLTWEVSRGDRVYVVQGFTAPPASD